VTPEEREEALEVFNSAIAVANKFGPLIIQETDGHIPVTTAAASLLMAGFCIQAEISMHNAVDMLMSAYKQAEAYERDKS